MGIPIFLGIMALVFFLTFTVGDFLKGYFELGLELFSAKTLVCAGRPCTWLQWLISLIVDGIVAGVGGILTFLPNIFILFLALAFLEDSGYMARVAYVMNETMGMVGLSGKAFLPDAAGLWLHGARSDGDQGIGERKGQAQDDPHHALYVMLRQAAHLCAVCG